MAASLAQAMMPAPSASVAPGVPTVSVIVPTIGRPEALRRLLESLLRQTVPLAEVIVADGSADDGTAMVTEEPRWRDGGLAVTRIPVRPPHAVRQRMAAIAASRGELLLLLDDDVALEPECTERLIAAVNREPGIVSASADFNNQTWPPPSPAWRLYLRYVLGMPDGSWQGRVVGPLLRFGFTTGGSTDDRPIDWLASGNTLIRRSAYEAAGGFSSFFLHRSTINEDVDLGLKVSAHGRLVFCPTARMAHYHDPGGRVSAAIAAEDDLHNRYLILRHTRRLGFSRAFGLVVLFFTVETTSNVIGGLGRWSWPGFWPRTLGRLRALRRALVGS